MCNKKESIIEQFNLISKEYDANRRKFIPCFDEFYQGTTDFIVKSINEPRKILDLGAGTGILSSYWYKYFSYADYTLLDIAEKMLDIAKKRFYSIANVHFCVCDYTKDLPCNNDVIISALSIHHLENIDKLQLFSNVYNALNINGVFVNYDQFCAGNTIINNLYTKYWESYLNRSGLTNEDLCLWEKRRLLDRECSVEQQLEMIRKAGFEVCECVYACGKFCVVLAIKN